MGSFFGVATIHFGWSPSEFYDATPKEWWEAWVALYKRDIAPMRVGFSASKNTPQGFSKEEMTQRVSRLHDAKRRARIARNG
jgi:hypothetical protein